MKKLRFASASACVLALVLAACADRPALKPAPGAEIVPDGGNAARADVAGVSLVATAGAWDGGVDIAEAVTPLKVTIDNDSGKSLRIRYSDFGLVTETGTRYAALPPYSVRGSVTEPVVAGSYRPIYAVGFRYRGFLVAPHYRILYPTLAPHRHRFPYDPFYYSHYYPYWDAARVRVELPTPEMLRKAVPEGVLEAGGELEGFLYFEEMPERLAGTQINFHLELVDAVDGERFATLHIPFVASDGDSYASVDP